ncbi:hypothetical protein [Dyadobacter sp. Leaf189]|uniref:hypothetical protein n=1 Tax=Dyadobacter sp. Leaf189 TaxID=1736295 RepID=UPI0007005D06|nr:hypothetical protein [Dyadobacter sp. Leaf189]KQS30660.1 hypothetical protein ASG33_09710 [Dyadobacter sp. Leaf189]
MSKTVVGIFEMESEARTAQRNLLASGFTDAEVDIKTASYKTAPDESLPAEPETDWLDRLGHFFRDLFNGDQHETERYTQAGKRGTIVTVHASGTEQAEIAAAILDESGAQDLHASDNTGKQYEDPIVNPPSVSEHLDKTAAATSWGADIERREASARVRSRIVERKVEQSLRLREERDNYGTMPVNHIGTTNYAATPDERGFETPTTTQFQGTNSDNDLENQEILNRTVEERDAMINDIVQNETKKPDGFTERPA